MNYEGSDVHTYDSLESKLNLIPGKFEANREKSLTHFDPEEKFRPDEWTVIMDSDTVYELTQVVRSESNTDGCVCSHYIEVPYFLEGFGVILVLGSDCIKRFEVPHLTKAVESLISEQAKLKRVARRAAKIASGELVVLPDCNKCSKILTKICVNMTSGKKVETPQVSPDVLLHVKCAKRCRGCEEYKCVCRRCVRCDRIISGPRWKIRCYDCWNLWKAE
jgi:hypothetical protein